MDEKFERHARTVLLSESGETEEMDDEASQTLDLKLKPKLEYLEKPE
jgi:hypothetical protein